MCAIFSCLYICVDVISLCTLFIVIIDIVRIVVILFRRSSIYFIVSFNLEICIKK